MKGRCPRDVMVKPLDCWIVVNEFELQSHYYAHFRADTLGKGMNPPYSPYIYRYIYIGWYAIQHNQPNISLSLSLSLSLFDFAKKFGVTKAANAAWTFIIDSVTHTNNKYTVTNKRVNTYFGNSVM